MEADKPQEKHTKYTVSVRIKPNQKSEPTCLVAHQSKFIKQIRPKSIVTYCFDSVFEEQHENEYIYKESLKKTVDFFIHKKINTTILAYGQTGSGKTYTLFGSQTKNQLGLVDYMTEDIMDYVNAKGLTAKCSFMQIYKEKVSDLMTSAAVQLRQNGSGELFLENLQVFEIKNKQQLSELLKKAHSNKIFGQSYINSESSRSHVIFTIQFQKRKFNVVDLCGSQVLTYKFNEQQREETNSINLSLFTLNAVVNDLAFSKKSKNQFIPFRNSVLTRILKESLLEMEKSQIYLFCNVSPEEKHQAFSCNTLRFGQLAIQIDEANNIMEEKVNLSQQKRQKKIISNVIDMSPETNKSPGTYTINWTTKKMKILENRIRIYELLQENAECNILILHAYGYGCCGDDWNLHVSYLTKNIKANIYSVDFPGFGQSEGKKFTSRSEKFSEKDQPIEFMAELFKILEFSTKKKAILMGYDLGGAIGLSCCLDAKLSKMIEIMIAFHPTWTDSIEKLAPITVPTLLHWFAVETFHLISAGLKMAKIIKSSRLHRYNVGPYMNEKAGGYYDAYSETMAGITANFIREFSKQPISNPQKGGDNRMRGKIVEQKIMVDINEEEEKLKNSQEAVRQIFRMKGEKSIKDVYETILKGGANKPKCIRLASQLPDFDLKTFSWEFLQKYNLIQKMPIKNINFDELPFLIPNQQLQITTKINLNALQGANRYLSYDINGDVHITHKAVVIQEQSQQQILANQSVKVRIPDVNGKIQIVAASLADILYLNSPTLYKKNNQGHLLFEDSVTCNYSSHMMKLKLAQCCYHLQPLIAKMDFSKNDDILLSLQKECTKVIYSLIDLTHLVHQGIDNTRYTGTDVGKLAYYGQGNCHHLASVTAALLLPFGKILGWDVIFRAGSFFKTGREIDQDGNPLKDWNGKPKVNVEDHTWLEVRYKPSYQVYVFDPSFAICSDPLDQIYSFEGRMHISGKKLNFALEYQVPEKLWPNIQ